MSTWQDQMYAELDAMEPLDRIRATGRWITDMTQVLLPDLGVRRREAILEAIAADPEGGSTKVAELIGARPGTIARLAAEARTYRKRQLAHDAA